jgi:predicted nucleic acid-binding protein
MGIVKVVSNSLPIINLSKIDKLDLLEKIFGEVIIPKAV